jgi:SAM-dependent methyltransferase
MSDSGTDPGLGQAVSRSIEDFDAMYRESPPWEIGRPQPVFVRLAEAGAVTGRVLDAGCGTGENALMLAAAGLDVTGIDAAPRAIAEAQRKAVERGLNARFLVWDALRLVELDEKFDTVIDSGLFHVFDDGRRALYIQALGEVVRQGGRYVMCCFSDRQPGVWGPRRVRQEEIHASFTAGWRVESIEAVEFQTILDPPTAQAWLSTITHT